MVSFHFWPSISWCFLTNLGTSPSSISIISFDSISPFVKLPLVDTWRKASSYFWSTLDMMRWWASFNVYGLYENAANSSRNMWCTRQSYKQGLTICKSKVHHPHKSIKLLDGVLVMDVDVPKYLCQAFKTWFVDNHCALCHPHSECWNINMGKVILPLLFDLHLQVMYVIRGVNWEKVSNGLELMVNKKDPEFYDEWWLVYNDCGGNNARLSIISVLITLGILMMQIFRWQVVCMTFSSMIKSKAEYECTYGWPGSIPMGILLFATSTWILKGSIIWVTHTHESITHRCMGTHGLFL